MLADELCSVGRTWSGGSIRGRRTPAVLGPSDGDTCGGWPTASRGAPTPDPDVTRPAEADCRPPCAWPGGWSPVPPRPPPPRPPPTPRPSVHAADVVGRAGPGWRARWRARRRGSGVRSPPPADGRSRPGPRPPRCRRPVHQAACATTGLTAVTVRTQRATTSPSSVRGDVAAPLGAGFGPPGEQRPNGSRRRWARRAPRPPGAPDPPCGGGSRPVGVDEQHVGPLPAARPPRRRTRAPSRAGEDPGT